MQDVYINSIRKLMPNQPISNDEIEEYLGYIGGKKSKAKKIVLRSNGIKSRFYVLEKDTQKPLSTNAQLTASVIKKLIDDDFELKDIECLSCGTTTPDQFMPNHTLMVQGELGISEIETNCASGICLSGVNALKYTYYSIKSGEVSVGVCAASEVVSPLLCAKNFEKESTHLLEKLEKNSSIAFEKDFLRWMLSDGAGAMLLSNLPNKSSMSLKIEFIDLISYAGEMPVCMYSGLNVLESGEMISWKSYGQEDIMKKSLFSIKQNVKLLNDNIVKYTVTKPLKTILKRRDILASDYRYFLPHYSSNYFRDKLYEGLIKAGFEISYDKWFTNLQTYGNTGAASIYIMLEELFNSSKIQRGDKIFCYIPESGRFSTAFISLKVV